MTSFAGAWEFRQAWGYDILVFLFVNISRRGEIYVRVKGVRVPVVFGDYPPPRSRRAFAARQPRSPSFPREIRNYCIQAFRAGSDLSIDRGGTWSSGWDCRNNSGV